MATPIKSLAVLLGAMLAVAACSIERADTAREAREQLVGRSKAELLACAGQPNTTVKEGNAEYLLYYRQPPDFDTILGRQPNRIQQLTGTAEKRNCQATILLRNGIVQSVSYRGNTGGLITQGEACADIVQRCVSE